MDTILVYGGLENGESHCQLPVFCCRGKAVWQLGYTNFLAAANSRLHMYPKIQDAHPSTWIAVKWVAVKWVAGLLLVK